MAHAAPIVADSRHAARIQALREIGKNQITRRAGAPEACVAIKQAGAGNENHGGA